MYVQKLNSSSLSIMLTRVLVMAYFTPDHCHALGMKGWLFFLLTSPSTTTSEKMSPQTPWAWGYVAEVLPKEDLE